MGESFVAAAQDLTETLEDQLESDIGDLRTSFAATHKYTEQIIAGKLKRFALTREGKPLGVDMRHNSLSSKVYLKRKRAARKRNGRIAVLRKAARAHTT